VRPPQWRLLRRSARAKGDDHGLHRRYRPAGRIDAVPLILDVICRVTGMGFAAVALAKLFQPYFRAVVRPSQEGPGLGLYIASEIARTHGGTLEVDSDRTATRFTFRMPLSR